MSENPSSPLLGGSEDAYDSRHERPASQQSRELDLSKQSEPSKHSVNSRHSEQSIRSRHSQHSEQAAESTPLLSLDANHPEYGDRPARSHDVASAAASSLSSLQDVDSVKAKAGRGWPLIVALTLLCLIFLTILGLGFAAPAVVEEYTKDAMMFEPTDLSIDSLTSSGVRARIQGYFTMDASRVNKKPVRDLGRFGTWIVQAVESKNSKVNVYLPEYGNVLLGSADVPRIVVDVRNGHTTQIDFLSDLVAGDVDGIRRVANDWLDGRLGQLRVQAVAKVGVKSGLFSFGSHSISESLVFKDSDIPTIPHYNITKLNFREVHLKHDQKGMAADVSLTLINDYPLAFTIPPLGFDILVQDCSPQAPYISLADAQTGEIKVLSRQDVNVDVMGIIRELPETLITACPTTGKSPLDLLLGDYMNGDETTIYVRGTEFPLPSSPRWLTELLKSIVVPLPFPGHTFDNLIRDFSLTNVQLSLPDPFAAPESPKSQPRLSAMVKALVNLPQEMNFPIQVDRVRADADVFYHSKKLGTLDLSKWQKANSTHIDADGITPAGLAVESIVKKAPLEITDDDVFADLVEALIFGGSGIVLGVKAQVDVETETALGKFIVRDLPAEGKVFVKPISGGHLPSFNPHVRSLRILDTTKSSILLQADIDVTNPTDYAATVPYLDLHLLSNETLIGHATAHNIFVVPGHNRKVRVTALWDPESFAGETGVRAGRELLSQYISGYNTTLTFRTHANSIPTRPRLGAALSALSIRIPTPHLAIPKNPFHDPDDRDPDPERPHFIDDATLHLLTSTATITLLSPLPSPITITCLNATATYNATPLASILHLSPPFTVPPGVSISPHFPVDWSLGEVGYDTVKRALGGRLRVDAWAEVGVRLGKWEGGLWFEGRGVGARIRWF